MDNLQQIVFVDPDEAFVNELFAASVDRFLWGAEVTTIMGLFDVIPTTAYVPPLTPGLYRMDSPQYRDDNVWEIVGPGNATTISGHLRENGVVRFNFTQSRTPILEDGTRLYKRVIRRRGDWGLFTLVHYIFR